MARHGEHVVPIWQTDPHPEHATGARAIKHVSFEALLGLAAHHAPASYWDIVKRDNPRKGVQTMRRTPRRRKTATGTRQDGAPSALGADHNQPIKPVHPLHIDEPGTTG
jgi:hypothetical protein